MTPNNICMLPQKHDLSGKRFGKWLVSNKWEIDETHNRAWWCKCDCGLEKWVRAQYLKNGTSTQCTICATKRPGYGVHGIPPPLWKRINTNAAKRNITISITKEEAFDLFLSQNRKCALTGWDITMAKNAKEHNAGNYTASLDRIDSSIGYIPGNIQWVHKDVNLMKNTFSTEYLCKLCRAIIKNVCPDSLA